MRILSQTKTKLDNCDNNYQLQFSSFLQACKHFSLLRTFSICSTIFPLQLPITEQIGEEFEELIKQTRNRENKKCILGSTFCLYLRCGN